MAQPRRGRPPNPVDPEASHAAKLGAELRARRTDAGLTLEQLADLVHFSQQHISEVERAKTTPGAPFIAACERALDAHGELEPLLPPVLQEHDQQRRERAAARRADPDPSLPCPATHSEAGDDDVDPTNRRGLLGAGATVALGAAGVAAAPTQARQIDPELPSHLTGLLRVLGRHDEVHGPHEVLSAVLYELRLIAEHRSIAGGELRRELMRVEARWADLAAWLSEDTGARRGRVYWTDRALRLAREADDADMTAFSLMRRSVVAPDSRRAVAHAENALRVPDVSAQTRAVCARQAAQSFAAAGNAVACERRLADAYGLLEDRQSPAPPWAGGYRVTSVGTLAAEAVCWGLLEPSKAIPLYERALSDWPHDEARDGGLHRARLARACAAIGERDRAKAEGRKAFAVAQTTKSSTIERELQRLGAELRAA